MNVHHVGYAVRSIEKAVPIFEALGFDVNGAVVDDEGRNVRIVFMQNMGVTIELVAPLHSPSPIDAILAKSGAAPYHICYEVECLREAVVTLTKQGFKPFTAESPAPAIEGCAVVFLYNPVVGVIELVERKG